MLMIRILLITTTTSLISVSVAAEGRISLCTKSEEAVFACTIPEGKVISICASLGLNENEGYIQYRFGNKNDLELEFPSEKSISPQSVFTLGSSGIGGGGTDFLRFRIENFTYTVFGYFNRGLERDGVVVEKDGKRTASLICKAGALQTGRVWRAIYNAKLPKDSDTLFEPPW